MIFQYFFMQRKIVLVFPFQQEVNLLLRFVFFSYVHQQILQPHPLTSQMHCEHYQNSPPQKNLVPPLTLHHHSKLPTLPKAWKSRLRDKIHRLPSEERESSCVVLWAIGACVSCSDWSVEWGVMDSARIQTRIRKKPGLLKFYITYCQLCCISVLCHYFSPPS